VTGSVPPHEHAAPVRPPVTRIARSPTEREWRRMSPSERRLWEREVLRQYEKELRAKREKKAQQVEHPRSALPAQRYYRAGASVSFSNVFR
jgi:hypothetical protein